MGNIVEACNVRQILPRNRCFFFIFLVKRNILIWQLNFFKRPPVIYKMRETFFFFFIPKLGLLLNKEERQQWHSRTYLPLLFFLPLLEFRLQSHMGTHLGTKMDIGTHGPRVILTLTTTAPRVHNWNPLSAVSHFNTSLAGQLLLLRF